MLMMVINFLILAGPLAIGYGQDVETDLSGPSTAASNNEMGSKTNSSKHFERISLKLRINQ